MFDLGKHLQATALSGIVLFASQPPEAHAQRRGLPNGVTPIQGTIAPGYSVVPGVPFTVGSISPGQSVTANGVPYGYPSLTNYSYISGYNVGGGPNGPDVISNWVSANGFTGPNQGIPTSPNLGYFGNPPAAASVPKLAPHAALVPGVGTTVFGSTFSPPGSPAVFGGLDLNHFANPSPGTSNLPGVSPLANSGGFAVPPAAGFGANLTPPGFSAGPGTSLFSPSAGFGSPTPGLQFNNAGNLPFNPNPDSPGVNPFTNGPAPRNSGWRPPSPPPPAPAGDRAVAIPGRGPGPARAANRGSDTQTPAGPGVPDTVIPVARMSYPYWVQRHQAILAQDRRGNIDVVFLGDSITAGWSGNGAAVWKRYFEPLHAANFGIGGDKTQHVLYRVGPGGELKGIQPKVIVLMVGTNNLDGGHNTPQQVAAGISAILAEVHAEQPQARVLLLGVFPRNTPNSPIRQNINTLNELLAAMADGKSVTYLDAGSKLLNPKGYLPSDTTTDGVHLTAKGYQIWADAIDGTLKAMLNGSAGGSKP